YLYSDATGQFLSGQSQEKLNPRLLVDSFYWRGWLDNLKVVLRPPFVGQRFSIIVLAAACAAVLLARTKSHRACLLALWLGYAVFGLTFTNHISSHDYYSLPLIPIVALSLATLVDAANHYLGQPLGRPSVRAAVGALV